MTQKPFAARNSDNGCLRGIDGMPSHKMISLCFLCVRDGGRNSATISFLNRARNMSRHYRLGRRATQTRSGILAEKHTIIGFPTGAVERIRDKMAASKKRGYWIGGTPPPGQ